MSTLDDFADSMPTPETLYNPNLDAQYDTGRHELNLARKRLLEEDLPKAAKRSLHQFDKKLKRESLRGSSDRKAVTRAWYLDIARILQNDQGGFVSITDEGQAGEKALDDLIDYIQNDREYANNYIHNLMIAIKTYGELMGSDNVQERFEEITPGSWRETDQSPLPGNVISFREAVAMAQTRDSIRDQALILGQWGLGARPKSELFILRYKHFDWQDNHYEIQIPGDSKTGSRSVTVFPGAAILRKYWEEHHPVHADPEAELGPDTYLCVQLNKNSRVRYQRLYQIFLEAGIDAGISKDTNPQNFRRSRASFLSGKPTIDEANLRDHFGWSFNSDAPKHYITSFGGDSKRNIANADGADTTPLGEYEYCAPIVCDGCERWTERHMTRCIHCGHEIDSERHETSYTANVDSDKDLLTLILEGDADADDIRSVQKLWPVIQSRPSIADNFEELIDLTDRMDAQSVAGITGLGAMLVGGVIGAGEKAAATWAQAKHRALSIHPKYENYPSMSRTRLLGLGAGLSMHLLFTLSLLSAHGYVDELQAGDVSAWLSLVIAAIVLGVLVDRDLPTIEEAEAAARTC